MYILAIRKIYYVLRHHQFCPTHPATDLAGRHRSVHIRAPGGTISIRLRDLKDDDGMTIELVHLQTSWEQTLTDWHIEQSQIQAAFQILVEAYHSPGRVYHTLEHVGEVLSWISILREQAHHLPTIQLAAWFHDSVYDPHMSNNEEQSAAFARDILTQLGLDQTTIQPVTQMILCTKSHLASEQSGDSQILLDADLAILGAPEERYQAYTEAIRQEYYRVPTTTYQAARLQILQQLLHFNRIYQTDTLFTLLEEQARTNMRREINALISQF